LSKALSTLVFIALVLSACSDSNSTSSNAFPPMIGAKYLTGKPHTPDICSTSDNAMNQALDALGKNDTEGAEQALAGTMISINPGTKVLILNYDILKGVVDMRIYSGDQEGTRVYCEIGTEDDGFFAKKIADAN
jgi:ABC-type oligopeptide transport system substrate-binding subunit